MGAREQLVDRCVQFEPVLIVPQLAQTARDQAFLSTFELEYGTEHPTFVQDSYKAAVRQANNEAKYLMVYLHSAVHEDTPAFCRYWR
jgi:hypothetical protein